MAEKPLSWLGSSLDDLRAFPADARRDAGYQLGRVQQGLLPTDWKPVTTVGAGVVEIRVHTRLEHRVFYIASSRKLSTCCTRLRNGLARHRSPRLHWPKNGSLI